MARITPETDFFTMVLTWPETVGVMHDFGFTKVHKNMATSPTIGKACADYKVELEPLLAELNRVVDLVEARRAANPPVKGTWKDTKDQVRKQFEDYQKLDPYGK